MLSQNFFILLLQSLTNDFFSHNLTFLQVASQKLTLKQFINYITDVICKRADLGYSYGVIIIPEGLIDFIHEVNKHLKPSKKVKKMRIPFWPCHTHHCCYFQVQLLIYELNEILANEKNLFLSLCSFLICFLQQFKINCCLKKIHMEMSTQSISLSLFKKAGLMQ